MGLPVTVAVGTQESKIELANGGGAAKDSDTAISETSGIVETRCGDTGGTERLDANHEGHGIDGEPRRQQWYAAVPTVVALCASGALAVGIAVSAVLVVSRESVGPTGAVIPTHPLPTTMTTAIPPSMAPSLPTPTQAPTHQSTSPPTTLIPTTVQPIPAPRTTSPQPSVTLSTTAPPPKSVAPTTHRPFPQETTDFLGPPGTNN